METHILVSFDRNAVAGAVIGVRTLGALPFDGQVLKVQVAARLAFGDVCGIDAGGLLRCINTLVGIEVQEGDVPNDDVTAILDMYATETAAVECAFAGPVNGKYMCGILVPAFHLHAPHAVLILVSVALVVYVGLGACYRHILRQTVGIVLHDRFGRVVDAEILPSVVAADIDGRYDLVPVLRSHCPKIQDTRKETPHTFGRILTFSGGTTYLVGKGLQNLYGIISFGSIELDTGLLQQIQDAGKNTSDTFGGILTVLGSTAYLCRQFLQCPKRIVSLGRLE